MGHNQSDLDDSRAPFLSHLGELRTRIWWSIVAVFVTSAGCFIFADQLGALITDPIITGLKNHNQNPQLASRTVQGGFLFSFKIALVFGIFCAIPVILYQIWQFVAPGLYRHERRFALPFVVLSSMCFIGGALFAYYLVLPAVFDFLIGYSTELAKTNLKIDITIEDSLGFTTKLLLAFGIVFELPVAVAFLAWIGMVTHRGLTKFWRWAVVIAFILGAALTPPDLVSQLFLAGPLVTLYGISIGIAYIITMRRERNQDDDDGDDDDDDPDDPEGGTSTGTTTDPPPNLGIDSRLGTQADMDYHDDPEHAAKLGILDDEADPVGPIGPVFEDVSHDAEDELPLVADPSTDSSVEGGTPSDEGATDGSDGNEDKRLAVEEQQAQFAARQLDMPFDGAVEEAKDDLGKQIPEKKTSEDSGSD